MWRHIHKWNTYNTHLGITVWCVTKSTFHFSWKTFRQWILKKSFLHPTWPFNSPKGDTLVTLTVFSTHTGDTRNLPVSQPTSHELQTRQSQFLLVLQVTWTSSKGKLMAIAYMHEKCTTGSPLNIDTVSTSFKMCACMNYIVMLENKQTKTTRRANAQTTHIHM